MCSRYEWSWMEEKVFTKKIFLALTYGKINSELRGWRSIFMDFMRTELIIWFKNKFHKIYWIMEDKNSNFMENEGNLKNPCVWEETMQT